MKGSEVDFQQEALFIDNTLSDIMATLLGLPSLGHGNCDYTCSEGKR